MSPMNQSEDEKYKLLERLIDLDGGIDPKTGKRVMSNELWQMLVDEELRALEAPKRFAAWDSPKLDWCRPS